MLRPTLFWPLFFLAIQLLSLVSHNSPSENVSGNQKSLPDREGTAVPPKKYHDNQAMRSIDLHNRQPKKT